MKNEEIVVIKSILELLVTMEEALAYIKTKLEKDKVDDTIMVLRDFVEAFTTMDISLNPILNKLEDNAIQEKTDDMKIAINRIIGEYEQTNLVSIIEAVDLYLEPSFINWKLELEEGLRPHTLLN